MLSGNTTIQEVDDSDDERHDAANKLQSALQNTIYQKNKDYKGYQVL